MWTGSPGGDGAGRVLPVSPKGARRGHSIPRLPALAPGWGSLWGGRGRLRGRARRRLSGRGDALRVTHH